MAHFSENKSKARMLGLESFPWDCLLCLFLRNPFRVFHQPAFKGMFKFEVCSAKMKFKHALKPFLWRKRSPVPSFLACFYENRPKNSTQLQGKKQGNFFALPHYLSIPASSACPYRTEEKRLGLQFLSLPGSLQGN
ncbi:hypothetical protein [Rufibacter sp. XAAS-G3-1]|uniref:hypothetical protein n=1 Tax=Rufibacter sp. XAAS-G3-1 TaxID=2729134 RepID=UPI0015E74CE4|nr:hypothetical protein [Rufibacter sp. XAAS-G3-1]